MYNDTGEPSAWCYTTDPNKRWELCDIPTCSAGGGGSGGGGGGGGPDYTTCGTASLGQADYRGTVSMTETGKSCMAWTAQSPHSHTRTPTNYPLSGLENNYCRNPDGEDRAWCYTTDSNSRWEFCNIPNC